MSQSAASTTLHHYRQISAQDTDFSNEVVVCACIYLACKIYEDERKIRDILNAICYATKLYTISASN